MRKLLVAAAMALLVAAATGVVTNAKSKAPGGQAQLAQAVPLLVTLAATNATLITAADDTAELTLSGLDDVALRLSRGEAIPMPLGTLALFYEPLFGGEGASAVMTVASGDAATAPTRVPLELGTPVFDQEALSMTFPASLPAWATGHPAALSWAEPDLPIDGTLELGPVSLTMSGAGSRSAIVGPLEILVSPASDGRSVGLVVVGGEGAPIASAQMTPDAPYVSFAGSLSDGTTVEGEMEATFTGGGGRIVLHRVEASGPRSAKSKGLLAAW